MLFHALIFVWWHIYTVLFEDVVLPRPPSVPLPFVPQLELLVLAPTVSTLYLLVEPSHAVPTKSWACVSRNTSRPLFLQMRVSENNDKTPSDEFLSARQPAGHSWDAQPGFVLL